MLEMIPNTPPVGLVGVTPGRDGVAGIAVVPLLRRDADIVHFPAGSGWSDQALVVDELAARRPGTAPTSTETEVSSGGALAPYPEKMGQAPQSSVSPALHCLVTRLVATSPDGGACTSVQSGQDTPMSPCETEVSSGGALAPYPEKM